MRVFLGRGGDMVSAPVSMLLRRPGEGVFRVLFLGLVLLLSVATWPGGVQGQEPFRAELMVVDASNGAPVSWPSVEVAGAGTVLGDRVGRVSIRSSSREVTVVVERLGFETWEGVLVLDGARHRVALEPAPLAVAPLVVHSRALGRMRAVQPTSVVSGRELAERMSASVAAAIAWEPGVYARSNGPMATQPVIRGLGGDRVLVLEDGLRTGDISTTAPDHAVTIEPASARQIEVIRGPGGLLYGSNTLGGVVNVVRDDIPRDPLVQPLTWHASAYGESVNRGLSTAGRLRTGRGPVVAQIEASGRSAGDTRTPGGVPLPFTDLDGFEVAAGLSVIGDGGHVGAGIREYRTFYGVPSSYDGVALPGAHEEGVYVDAHRTAGRFDAEWRRTDEGREGDVDGFEGFSLESVSVGGNAVRFEQWEFEEGGFVGTRFGQLAASVEAVARIRAGSHRGAVGSSYQWRDLRAEGSFTGTRPAVLATTSLFTLGEWDWGRWTFLGGARLDWTSITPLDSTETLLLRNIRARSFAAVTGAVGARARIAGGWTAALQVARAFRPPSIEELYSAGPHLASYAYEVGRPDLAAERGLGLDGSVRWEGVRGRVEVAAYAMHVADYITFAPVIDPSSGLPLRDPRLRRYIVYRPEQVHARLVGVEGRASLALDTRWGLEVAADLPRGTTDGGEPLPSMPPPSGRAEVRHQTARYSVALNGEGRWPQRRVPSAPPAADAGCDLVVRDGEASVLPADFCPTPGAVLLGAVASVTLPRGGVMAAQTVLTLGVENLLDTTWRDPLWRARLVAPQPGRNLRVSVRVTP